MRAIASSIASIASIKSHNLFFSKNNYQPLSPPACEQRSQQTAPNTRSTLSLTFASTMVSDDQVIVNDGQSHLLKLPGELRNRICDYALTSDGGFEIAENGNSHKSGLLEACHQLRDETRLLYHEYNDFHIIVTMNNIDVIRRWAATIHDDELRSIPSLGFQFRMKYGQLTRTKTDRYEAHLAFESRGH